MGPAHRDGCPARRLYITLVKRMVLDARNLPCNFLPPIQEPEGWNVLRNMLINLINEDRVSAVGVWSRRTWGGDVMARQMHRHDQLRDYGGGDFRQGDWIVEVAHRPSTQY